MTLGTILSSTVGLPICGRNVEFYIVRRTGAGAVKFRVKALLVPVSEADRIQSVNEAIKYLRTKPEYQEKEDSSGQKRLPEIPRWVIEEEVPLRFLAVALCDADNPVARFIGASPGEYDIFRQGITDVQISWLRKEYDRLMADEYPEVITQKDLDSLEKEALGK